MQKKYLLRARAQLSSLETVARARVGAFFSARSASQPVPPRRPSGSFRAHLEPVPELVELCGKHGLMTVDLGEGSPRSLATKMGTLAGRFINELFPLTDGRQVKFHRSDSRKGKVYQVFVKDEVPNLGAFAEPMPNLEIDAGSAP